MALILNDHEHVVDIDAPQIKAYIKEAQKLFDDFYQLYVEKFDLSDESTIREVYAAAERMGIFKSAKEIRRLIFGNNISLYGVCYLGTKCNQNCRFCPMGQENWKMHLSGNISSDRLLSLSLEEASRDLDALIKIGHTEICILAGEEISSDPMKVIAYVQLAVNKPGVKEVILNMGSYKESIFRFIKENLNIPPGVKLTHRVFQETYIQSEYDFYTDRAPQGGGSKRDFDFRYNSQVAALLAGFDEVGIGTLCGLSRYPLKEIFGLMLHAAYIKKFGGKNPKRACLPIANNPEPDTNPVEVKYLIPGMGAEIEWMITELIYALARLAMPTISIVSSERDNPETVMNLLGYSNHTTLDVHPSPGGNIDALAKLQGLTPASSIEIPVAQAEVFPQLPTEALNSWEEKGFYVIGFDKAKYGF